jgi:hypothetical protein
MPTGYNKVKMFEFKFLFWELFVFVFAAKIHNLHVIKYLLQCLKDGGLTEWNWHMREMRNSSIS